VHPRLARILVEGRGAFEVAAACALLAEGRPGASAAATTSCDLLADLDRFSAQPPHVRQLARELQRLAGGSPADSPAGLDETRLRRALFAGFVDRLARRRAGTRDRLVLASGHGATLGRESGVGEGEFLVALDVTAATRDGAAEARVRMASQVEVAWITPTTVEIDHRIDPLSGRVKAFEVARAGILALRERPVPVDPAAAAALLAEAWLARAPGDDDRALLGRLRFAGLDVDLAYDVRARLEHVAPATLPVPSGRRAPLAYGDDGTVVASVKLQELFGLAETPTLGPNAVPVTFSLLAPNGRPVQTTRDLRSFWQGAYQEVRRELRGRYPKHPWPEDPWTARPTHRTMRSARKPGSAR
jgi:ATP-dependent helicase HrpB